MKKKKINYKSAVILLIAIAVGIFLGNKLAYYQMYRVQISHEKTLSIAVTAVGNEEDITKDELADDAAKDEDENDDEADNEWFAETDITAFSNEENAENDDSALNSNSADKPSESANSSLININTADKAALDTLPGIGEVKAQAIIDYRNKYGNFLSTEEIMNVNGIGEKTYENLKDLICI